MTARKRAFKMRRRGSNERGVTLVLVALSVLFLMIFVAFAVDIGLLYNERRQDQSAADAGATSGGVLALNGANMQAVVNEVLAKVTADVDRTVSNAQWTSCPDPNNLRITESGHTAASLGLTPATACISWSKSFDEMRVRLPDQIIETFFARVIGINSMQVSAFAHIEFVPFIDGSGGALPFVALAGATAGDHICLRTSSNPNNNPPPEMVGNGPNALATPGASPLNSDPCDTAVFDPASSTFGTLTPRDYLGGCDVQNTNVQNAIMDGTDHPTGFFGDPSDNNPPPFSIPANGTSSLAESTRQSTYGDVRIDGPGPNCTTFMPNSIQMNSGLSALDLRCAVLSPHNSNVCNSRTPRLRRVSSLPSSNLFIGERFDNTPPWAFIANSSNLPQDCIDVRNAYTTNDLLWDPHDRREEFLRCLDQWTAGAGSYDDLFTEAIGGNPRFAYVPQIAERRLCNSQDPAANCNPALNRGHVNSYVPVYLFRLYATSGNTTACDPLDLRPHGWSMHEPGQAPPLTLVSNCGGNGNGEALDRLSAIVLDCRSLPTTVCDEARLPGVPGNQGSVTSLYDLQLSR